MESKKSKSSKGSKSSKMKKGVQKIMAVNRLILPDQIVSKSIAPPSLFSDFKPSSLNAVKLSSTKPIDISKRLSTKSPL